MSNSLSAARPVARTVVLLLASTPFLLAESNSGADLPAPAAATAGAPASTSGAAHPQGPGAGGQGTIMLVMAIGLVAMFLFAGRSQKKEERKAQEMRSKLKRGDSVVTIGGMHGDVATVGEATVDIRLGSGDSAPVVTFNKSAIASIAGADVAKAK